MRPSERELTQTVAAIDDAATDDAAVVTIPPVVVTDAAGDVVVRTEGYSMNPER